MAYATIPMSTIAYRLDVTDQPTRNLGPSPDEWLRIKDVFAELYIAENRKLREVKDILSKNHGFDASEKMYKRRITEWKIHKNYKAQEKVALARRVKACVDAGNNPDTISFRGRPLKLDRVRRHCRNDKKLAKLWEHLSQSPQEAAEKDLVVRESKVPAKANRQSTCRISPVVTDTIVTTSSDGPSLTNSSLIRSESGLEMNATLLSASPRLTAQLDEPTDLRAANAVLLHTRDAIDWQFTAFTRVKLHDLQSRFPGRVPIEVITGQVDQVSAFWLALYHGYVFLKAGNQTRAFQTLDNSCQMVQPLLATAPLQLLTCLLLHFAKPWHGLDALEQQLLGFVSSMTANVLGRHHPLANALQLVATAGIREHVSESMMCMIVDAYRSRRKPSNSSVFALRIDQIDMLRECKKFAQAQTLCQEVVKESQVMGHKRHRTALAALGRIYADQNEEYAVEGVASRILAEERVDRLASDRGGTIIWAHDQLGRLYMDRRDYKPAERHLWRAILESRGRPDHRGPSTRSLIVRFQSCLSQQGRCVEIEEICAGTGIPLELVGW
ncbi:hypothetical protein H2204_008297 [Knufia peltigerae]|uniref:Clr5 domain-containing protein n=1 Tax=Knufia peltigerae TaxID=1002370 RepID=A0AA38Y058_9EURO|nr:hypothetical protein H2204_008297 [Knufia peltigerae]